MAKLKYGDASEFTKAEQAAGIEPTPPPPVPPPKNQPVVRPPKETGKTIPLSSIPIQHEGSRIAPPPQGNERTYKTDNSKEKTIKKSWWPW